jgi:hypothetical protein
MEGKQMENEKDNSMHDRLVNPDLCVESDNNLLNKGKRSGGFGQFDIISY